MVKDWIVQHGNTWAYRGMDKTIEIVAASCDDRDSLRGFPLILQVNA
jgi:hypothetical protein